MDATVVSAADSGYYHLLKGLVLSLRAQPGSARLPITVLDVGLAPDEVAWLERERCELVGVDRIAATLPPLPDRNDGKPKLSLAQRLRPHIPALVPGRKIYLWMDADLWLQRDGVLSYYLKAAERGRCAIVPEMHVAYPSMFSAGQYGGMFKTYERLFDRETAKALAQNPTLNSGCFALAADAPHWKLWADTLEALLRRDTFYYGEQFALNHVLYARKKEAPSLFLPAGFNWICHQALPVVDHKTGLLLEPTPPHGALGIVHLTVGAKSGEKALRSTDGGSVTRSLKFNGGDY
jgi:hypothetical protein